MQCNLDIAEILAFGNKLSDIDASLVEHYLGEKWDLNNIPGTTILDFATGQANNDDLANTFASNLSSSTSGATVINGGTPNISLEWYASSNVLELHGSGNSYWNQIDPGSSGVNVLQLDLDGGEEDPYIVFTVDSGKALFLDSVVIGHGSFQSKADHAWTISITEVGGVEAFTHTTAVMGINDSEFVDFNFTGKFGSSYILKFSDNGSNGHHGAIDNLRFSQIDITDSNTLQANQKSPASIPLNTTAGRNLSFGTSTSEDSGFEGTLDEVRIYNRSLTASEISILYLGGSVEFTTTNERQPPVVELYQARPESNNSVVLSGELTNIDLENPLVTIYYGSSDGGLSTSGWENNITLNNGNPLPAGGI